LRQAHDASLRLLLPDAAVGILGKPVPGPLAVGRRGHHMTYFTDYLLFVANALLVAGVVVAFVMALVRYLDSGEGWKP
jgi:hypothetical protein